MQVGEMPRSWSEWCLELFELGIPRHSITPDLRRRIRILSTATMAMFLIGIASAFQYWKVGVSEMSIALVVTMVAASLNLWLLRRTRDPDRCGHFAMAILSVLLVLSNIVSGGFYDPNFSWFYLLPLCASVVVGLRGAAFWTGVTLTLTVGYWLLPVYGIDLPNRIPPDLQAGQSLFTRVTAILGIAFLASSFVIGQRRTEHDLEDANQDLSRETAYVAVLRQAAVAANEATSLEQAMRDCVKCICTGMRWEVGHVCERTEDDRLVSTGIFHLEDPERFAELRAVTEKAECVAAETLPGRSFAAGRPLRVDDLSEDEGRARPAVARRAGLQSAFALPVLVNGEVQAVIEFASTRRLPKDDRLLEVFSDIGVQLGRVAERTALQERVRQSQKMEAVGQLAAGLAHEINNPMSYVRSNLHALKDEWRRLRPSLEDSRRPVEESDLVEYQQIIEEALEGVERTISIVRDVNEFSHAGVSAEDAWVPAEISRLLEDAWRVASPRCSPGVRMESDFESLPPLRCSPNQLRQVFVNLIVNAVQAIGEKGELRLTTGQEAGFQIARVEDDGPGVPEEIREHLFEPFFTTKGVGEGTGLGLYVSYEIIRVHGGDIEVHSRSGSGTVFEVRLPTHA